MSIFITGATGYLGSYVTSFLLDQGRDRLTLLVRATDENGAQRKLWRALQLHRSAAQFRQDLARIDFVFGDITLPHLGLTADVYAGLVRRTTSVLHIAASLNRLSETACLNTNLRGTLAVVRFARQVADQQGLRRFSHVSTVAVAGQRQHEVVTEDTAIDWNRRDYDPYARTKKFCEHLVRELLPDVPLTFFRPSIVMGDARFPQTTQFDMVQTFCTLADFPVLPFRPEGRIDIVNADFVGRAVATLHTRERTSHEIYHLSSGTASRTLGDIVEALTSYRGQRPTRFVPSLQAPFAALVDGARSLPGRHAATRLAVLLKVFLPYITFDTVFDNTRVCQELGAQPVPFPTYCGPLYDYAKGVGYAFPYNDDYGRDRDGASNRGPGTGSIPPDVSERAATST